MALALNNTIQYWRVRVHQSPVGEFVRWWLSELKQMLPESWQQRLRLATRRITILLDGASIRIGVEDGGVIRDLGEFPLQQDAALQQTQVRALIEQHELADMPRFLLLDESRVLRKPLRLPAAAEANLRQVLAFEMDRQTPFRASEVYFDWRIAQGSKEAAEIALELLVAPRKIIDAACDQVTARAFAPTGVDILEGGRALGVNLLPPERRVGVVNPRTRLNYGLAAAAAVLLVVVMAQSLNLRAGRVAELEAAIAEVQDDARRVQRLREQVQETGEAASFLTRKRARVPMAIEVLADVTRTLPDDTYLDRLVIGPDGVTMQGKSRNTQQLIEIVNKSDLLQDAAFRGSTRLDAATNLEIFEIGAVVSPRGGT